MPGPYVIEEAGSIIVSPRIAAGLERALNLDAYRISVRGNDRELDEVLLAWHSSAVQWVEDCRDQAKFRTVGTSFDDPRKLPDVLWGTDEVAARSGCTTRAVTAAAASGRLIGERIQRRWQFRPEDVARWRATRKRAR